MAKEFAKKFYRSKIWQQCRRTYIQHRVTIDGGLCEVCHKVPGYIVHHKVPLTPMNINNPEVSLSFNNLRFDCKECHDREDAHRFIKGKELKCKFDKDGHPIPPCKSSSLDIVETEKGRSNITREKRT